ncbi:MAG: AMP-binding protein, partial [Acidobacteriota bacterium]
MAANLIGFDEIPQTIPHFCIESFLRNGKPDALSFKVDSVWKRLSGLEVIERIKRIALGLSALGIEAGDRVAIISENRPEWSLVDIAIL